MRDGRRQAKSKILLKKVAPAYGRFRTGDKLEMIVDKEMWPMPSYGDLMFESQSADGLINCKIL